jgi:shikimate 5-dehydrogenase
MLNAAFGSTGIDAVYVPMETRDAPAFLTAAAALGVTGASVTAPLKSGWAERGVQVDEVGRAVGAINTLKRTSAGWSARNFDVDGFLAPFKVRQCNLQGTRVVVLGAGGAARAVAWALKREGAAVGLSARRAEAATALAADLGADAVAWPPDSADMMPTRRRSPPGPADPRGSCTTWSTTRRRRGCCATRARPAPRLSAASKC